MTATRGCDFVTAEEEPEAELSGMCGVISRRPGETPSLEDLTSP